MESTQEPAADRSCHRGRVLPVEPPGALTRITVRDPASTRSLFGAAAGSPVFMLADMATKVEAARLLVYNVAEMIDRDEKNFSQYSAMAKMYASDIAMQVTNDAIQILGGYGYMKEYPAERMMRDAKITQIYEGTNQIQRLVIARALLM